MQVLSTISSWYAIAGNSFGDARGSTRERGRRRRFMMLALWTAVTFLRPARARRTRTRSARSGVQARSVVTLMLSTTPGTIAVLEARSTRPRCSRARRPGRDPDSATGGRGSSSDRPDVGVEVERPSGVRRWGSRDAARRRRDGPSARRALRRIEPISVGRQRRALRGASAAAPASTRSHVDAARRRRRRCGPIAVGDLGTDAVAGNQRHACGASRSSASRSLPRRARRRSRRARRS